MINRRIKTIVNVLFMGLLAFVLLNSDAKAWLLRQVMSVGLLNAELKSNISKGAQASNFSFLNANGNTVFLQDLRGKIVFINFWATWCPPCKAEMPSLNELYEKFKEDRRVVFLFVTEDDDVNKANDYLRRNNFSFPIVISSGHVNETIFGGTLPTTVILGREGEILFRHEGMLNYNTETFYKQLKALL